jgi:hypothetical protein
VAIARVHRLTGDRYGYTGDRAHGATWRLAFTAIVDELLTDAVVWDVTLPVPAQRLRDVLARHEPVLDLVKRPALLHFDLWDGNLLAAVDATAATRLAGLVDGERYLYGDRLLDLVSPCLLRRIEDELGHPFLRGYIAESGEPFLAEETVRIQLALYRLHLYLIMLVEIPSRGMTGPYTNARRARIEPLLQHEVTRLEQPSRRRRDRHQPTTQRPPSARRRPRNDVRSCREERGRADPPRTARRVVKGLRYPEWHAGLVPEDADRSSARIELADLRRLAALAADAEADLFRRYPQGSGRYAGRLLGRALCQGAALHYVHGSNGVKDFDVWSFYAEDGDWPFPACWRGTRDFGPSKFGRYPNAAEALGQACRSSRTIASRPGRRGSGTGPAALSRRPPDRLGKGSRGQGSGIDRPARSRRRSRVARLIGQTDARSCRMQCAQAAH